ncbi:MAG: tetratricopeptide repeat protein, partial [Maribacter sp.]|nr:tetratricopeptide repeat protein [Maribacter sp.]
MKVFDELKRRNVIKATVAYIVVAWVLLQVITSVLPSLGSPPWVLKTLIFLIAIGLPIWIIFSWVYEITPEGLKKTVKVSKDRSIAQATNKRLNIIIIITLIIAIVVAFVNKPMPNISSQTNLPTAVEAGIGRSIAVLPFINMSNDPEQEALCDGLTEEIIHHLSRIKSFTKVISRSSVMSLKNSDKTLPEKAALLKVRTVLEGSFQQSGDRIKITAQLIDAANDNNLWSEIYERPFGDIFEIQAEIAKNIAAKFQAEITDEEEARLDKKPTESSEAYILLKKGLYKSWGNQPDLRGAIDLYKKAIETDPGLAEAYTALAEAYLVADIWYRGDKSIPVEDPLPLVQEALRLDPELADGYVMLAQIKHWKEWNFPEAETAYKKALELDPRNTSSNYIYAEFLIQMGRASEALPYIEKVVELAPTTNSYLSELAKFYFYAGNKEKAADIMEEYESLFQNELPGQKGLNYLYL